LKKIEGLQYPSFFIEIVPLVIGTVENGLPLFYVELAFNENNSEIFKINTLLNFAVVIEKSHAKRNSPPQCQTFQAYAK
jgi:hypothetical protein